jgi:hypothetical protein
LICDCIGKNPLSDRLPKYTNINKELPMRITNLLKVATHFGYSNLEKDIISEYEKRRTNFPDEDDLTGFAFAVCAAIKITKNYK